MTRKNNIKKLLLVFSFKVSDLPNPDVRIWLNADQFFKIRFGWIRKKKRAGFSYVEINQLTYLHSKRCQ